MKKILAIDDQQDNLTTIKAVIKGYMADCEVLTALSGKDGIEIAQKEQPDTILLDIIMPHMDGYETCKRLKEDEQTKHIPVVMITAIKTDSESRVKGLDIGADAFLSKPIDPIELTAQVNVMLRIKEAEDNLRAEKETLEVVVQKRTSELIESYNDLKLEVSERKQAENELQESKDYLNKIINTVASPLFVKNEKFEFSLVNDALCALLNLRADELIGKTGLEHFPKEQADVFIAKDQEVLNTGKENINEEYLTDGNGNLRTIITRKTLYTDLTNTKFLVGVINDITERKKTEKALFKSNELNKSITQSAADAIISINSEGLIFSWNKAAEKIFGYSSSEMKNKDLSKIIPKKYKAGHIAGINRINEGGIPKIIGKTIEITAIRKDETEFPIELSLSVWDSDNQKYFTSIIRDITERKKTEAALDESRNFLSTIYNNSEVALFVVKVNGIDDYTYEGINSQHEKLFKVKEEEYLGKSLRDLEKYFGKKAIDFLYSIYNECVKTKKSHRSEFEVPVNNKREWWYSTLTPIIDSNGNVTRIIGSAMNITDRKRVEAALRESENEYRTLVSNIPGITYRCLNDKDWSMDFISDDIEKLSGYSGTDFIKNKVRSYESIVHPDDSERIRDEIEKAIKNSEAYCLEYRIVCSNGDIKWVSENGIGIVDLSGKLIHLDGVILDITERKRAEQLQNVLYNIANAANAKNNLAELIRKIQEETGKIIDTSNFYIAFYNSDNDTLTFPFYEDQKDEFKVIDAKRTLTKYVIETNKSFIANINVKKKLVSEGIIEQKGSLSKVWLGVPLRIEGEVTGVLAVQSYTDENAFDESDMKILEFVSEQISISIDKKRKEEQLIVAKEKAEESDRLKTAFLANMSHEIRTPMNGIIGFSKLLSKPDLKLEKTNEYTTIITDCSNQLLSIVNDILDISKIETGQIDVYLSDVSVNSILSEVFTLFEHKAKEINIKLNIFKELDDGNDSIRTDPAKLKQILSNLVNNALKFTIEGSVSLGYSVKNDFIEFYVKDTGIGIPHKDKESVFNRFAQAENAEIDLRGGTGLGLSICKGYVGLLGGEIWLESEENNLPAGKAGGTEFNFTLPFNGNSIITENQMEQIKDDMDFNKAKILVVEDEMSNFQYLAELLNEKEIKYLHALNGKEAIELFKENPNFNLVLMDIRMPVMDGYEATKLIKKINPNIPVIAQTAYAFTQDREKILNSGFDDYISKPIEEDAFFNLLEKYFKKT